MDGMPILSAALRHLVKEGLSAEGLNPIPWDIIASHEHQAQENHGQTLKRLAERGGLGVSEAVAILEDRPWHRMDQTAAIERLTELIRQA